MSDPNEPRKRSPSLGQKIISKVMRTVRSLSGSNEKKSKLDQEDTTEPLAERLHREKLERDQGGRNSSHTMESFLQSGRNGPRIVQTRDGPRAIQEPSRARSPQRNRRERGTARHLVDPRSTSPPRGRSPTHIDPLTGTTARPSSPRHRRRTVTRAASRPGAAVRFSSPPREASSLRPSPPPPQGPSPLAAVPAVRSDHRVNLPRRESSRNKGRKASHPNHLHPDRFTPQAWPAPNTGVHGPYDIPGACAPEPGARTPAPSADAQPSASAQPNAGAQATPVVRKLPNIAAEGLHGIRGLPTTRKPVPAAIKQAAAAGALRGPGIEGSHSIEQGLEFQPVSARASLVNPTPPPEEDLGPVVCAISPLTEAEERSSSESSISYLDLSYVRIVADEPPVLRTPTILRRDARHSRFSGQALADMHVNLCKNCNCRPRSGTSWDLCHSCENLLLCRLCHKHLLDSPDAGICKSCGRKAAGDSPPISPVSPWHQVPQNSPVSPISPRDASQKFPPLCPQCRKNSVDIPGARFCSACERQLGYEYVSHSPRRRSSGGDDDSPASGASTRPKYTTRSEAPARLNLAKQPAYAVRSRPALHGTLDRPFSPGVPIRPLSPLHVRRANKKLNSPPPPPPKDTPSRHHQKTTPARHHQNTSRPRGPSTGNLSLSAFPPRNNTPTPEPMGIPTLPPVRGAGTAFEVRGSKPGFRLVDGRPMDECDGDFQRLIEAQWRLGSDASAADVARAVEKMRNEPRGVVETRQAKAVWDDEWLVPDRHKRSWGSR
ncbi:Serine/arginine repetitive matrix protein 1 [Xylographa trunciseda]|nr:Serine/arginine repetitive matrix protein 1 [Xylographa trunciseda]